MERNLNFLFNRLADDPTVRAYPQIADTTLGRGFVIQTWPSSSGAVYNKIIEHLSPEWIQFVNDGILYLYGYVPGVSPFIMVGFSFLTFYSILRSRGSLTEAYLFRSNHSCRSEGLIDDCEGTYVSSPH